MTKTFMQRLRGVSNEKIPIFRERVNWKGNSLPATASNVTTAPVLRLSASIWLDEYNIRSTLVEIPEAKVDSYYDEVKGIWEKIIPELKTAPGSPDRRG